MLGDRERCIQAQMDEYLSKPLKQNHLIQTILKCATLGGALLEKDRSVLSANGDPHAQVNGTPAGNPANSSLGALAPVRPTLDLRAQTTTGPITHGSVVSPEAKEDEDEDPLARVR